jgi:hypothetical protein
VGPLPVRQKIVRGRAFVQVRKAGDLAAHLAQPLLENSVLEIALSVEGLVRFWNRNLLRDYPSMKGAANVAKGVERVVSAHTSPGDTDQPDHLTLPLGETSEIERVLEHSAEAAMILRSTDDYTVRAREALTELLRLLRRGLAAIGEGEIEGAEVNKVGLGQWSLSGCESDPQRHIGITALTQTATECGDAYSSLLGHRTYYSTEAGNDLQQPGNAATPQSRVTLAATVC